MPTPPICLALGAIFLVISTLIRNNLRKMIKTGVEAEGVIFDFAENNNPNDPQRFPIIRFLTTDKTWITEQTNTYYTGMQKDQRVSVIYNPENPKQFILKTRLTTIIPLIFAAAGAILLAIGIYKLVA